MFGILTEKKNRKNIIGSILREKFDDTEYDVLLLSDVKEMINSPKQLGKKEYEFVIFLSDINDNCFRKFSVCMTDVMKCFRSKYIFTTI